MREILFRGKSLKDNEWTEGYYCRYGWTEKEKDYIIPDYASALYGVEVDSNTIGQYTGLTDKNGVKIFEGDIVEYETGKKVRIGRVFFSDFRASFSVTAGKNGSARINNDLFNYIQNRNSVIVIGNIYDNPELIGGADDENIV